MNNNQQIPEEINKIHVELQQAMTTLIQECGKELKDNERKEIEQELKEINELLERLKTGLVFVALFGKTSVGKSAVTNSLMNADDAEVGVEHDKTTRPTAYKKEPWNIVDVPGTMGEGLNEEQAIDEAKKAHGLIFVIDGEPYQDEIELFELVHRNSPNIPKIVFVNKWDIIENNIPRKDQDIIRSCISEKMRKFVKSPEDIVYGSAMLFDKDGDQMIRQKLPKLLDRLYKSAGILGTVMNVLDPAKRACEMMDNVNNHVWEIRLKVARKVISRFATAAALGIVVPLSVITFYPALWTSMMHTLCHITGKQVPKGETYKIMLSCLRIMVLNGAHEIARFVFVDAATTALTPVGGFGLTMGGIASSGGMGLYCYWQTAKLGEIILECIRNDFAAWGDQESKEVLKNCTKRAEDIYVKLQ